MADRKISELPFAQKVFDGDLLVAVTGYGQRTNPNDINSDYVSYITTKIPVSGFMAHAVRVNELVNGGTGIMVVSDINNTDPNNATPNTIQLNVTGVAMETHYHTVSSITNFASGVSGQVQQIIKFQTTDLACLDNSGTESNDLRIPLAANSMYLCELGTIFVNNETGSVISGLINVTGDMSVNYPTQMYGTWNRLGFDTNTYPIHNSSDNVSDYGVLVDTLDATQVNNPLTIVNKFTIETTSNEADTISFVFTTNSSNPATSGVLKKGSWLKAEKVI